MPSMSVPRVVLRSLRVVCVGCEKHDDVPRPGSAANLNLHMRHGKKKYDDDGGKQDLSGKRSSVESGDKRTSNSFLSWSESCFRCERKQSPSIRQNRRGWVFSVSPRDSSRVADEVR